MPLVKKAPLVPPPGVPPVNTHLDPTGDDMDDDLMEEINPPATGRKGEFGAVQAPATKRSSSKWTAGLDRESVRNALTHFQA